VAAVVVVAPRDVMDDETPLAVVALLAPGDAVDDGTPLEEAGVGGRAPDDVVFAGALPTVEQKSKIGVSTGSRLVLLALANRTQLSTSPSKKLGLHAVPL
jgi:hypothetical protein